jgi:hypothetical protein
MKKLDGKKLTLHRETLKTLAEGQLKEAAGASNGLSGCHTCLSECEYCTN